MCCPCLNHSLGLQGAGGFSINAEFLADAFMNGRYYVPTELLHDSDYDEFAPRVEAFYERGIGEENDSLWGVRVGLGYMDIEAQSNMTRRASLTIDLDVDMLCAAGRTFYEHHFTDMNAKLRTEVPGLLYSDSSSESDVLVGA